MQLTVFFVLVALCVAGSIFTAFDKMKRLKKIEARNQKTDIRKIRDVVSE